MKTYGSFINGIVLCFALVVITVSVRPEARAASVKWEKIASDLEVSRVYLWPGAVMSPELLFVRTALNKYRVSAIPATDLGMRKGSVQQICQKSGSVFGINANFFDENDKPLGLIVSNGFLIQPLHRGGKTLTGIFQVTRNSVSIIGRSNFNPQSVLEAVQAGPRLLSNGKATDLHKAFSSRRSGVCVDNKERVIFFITSGFMGATLKQIQEILQRPGIDCRNALNLDGGGSAQMFINGDLPGVVKGFQEILIHGRDDVPVILGLFVK